MILQVLFGRARQLRAYQALKNRKPPQKRWQAFTSTTDLAQTGSYWLLYACMIFATLSGFDIQANERVIDTRNRIVPGYKTAFELPNFTSLEGWQARKKELKLQVMAAAGLLPTPRKTELHARVAKRVIRDQYIIDTVVLETFPGFFLAGNLYTPTKLRTKSPGVLVPHGHWKHGRLENLSSYSVPALCINLAMKGYVAFAYDMIGYNDTMQVPHAYTGRREALWSFQPLALQTWNSIRALDYLQGLPSVDPERIAITGASGGGTQTFLLAAIDERIKFAAPVNMISAHMQGGDPCEEAPGLHAGTSNVEIAALIAPRPMLIVSSTRDWTKETPVKEFPAIQRIYALYGAAANVSNKHINAKHNYNRESREALYPMLAKYMRMPVQSENLRDKDVDSLPVDKMRLSDPQTEKRGFSAQETILKSWQEMVDYEHAPLDDLRTALRSAIGATWPAKLDSTRIGDLMVLFSEGMEGSAVVHWFPGTGVPLLLIHPDSASASLESEEAAQARRQGRPILALEPFESRERRLTKERFDSNFLSYNRSDDAIQVQNILVSAAFLIEETGLTPQVAASGRAKLWSLFSSAVAPVPLPVDLPESAINTTDQEFLNDFFVPGIQRTGGVAAALRLVRALEGN